MDIVTSDFRLVRIGRSIFPFTTFEEVSNAYRATIERLNLGGSETPSCEILNDRREVVGHVSYNGRVWGGDCRSWEVGKRPLYDPNGFYGDPQELFQRKGIIYMTPFPSHAAISARVNW